MVRRKLAVEDAPKAIGSCLMRVGLMFLPLCLFLFSGCGDNKSSSQVARDEESVTLPSPFVFVDPDPLTRTIKLRAVIPNSTNEVMKLEGCLFIFKDPNGRIIHEHVEVLPTPITLQPWDSGLVVARLDPNDRYLDYVSRIYAIGVAKKVKMNQGMLGVQHEQSIAR